MIKRKLAVIVPVFNALAYTRKCLKDIYELKSLLGDPDQQIQVVVVDDGSKDGTSEWIRENYPQVNLVNGTGSLWWSGGVNKGVRYALDVLEAEYILWWNNDVIPREDYLENLVKIINSSTPQTIIGSKIYRMGENLVWGMGGKFDPVSGERYMYGEGQEDNELLSKPFEVDWFPGMGTAFHSSVFESVGMLDEKRFPQYHGDSDYTLRAKAAGFKLVAYPELVIFNDNSNTGMFHGESFIRLYKSLFSIKSIYGIRRDYLFLKKHATSYRAFIPFFKKYLLYIGGFFKWKVLSFFGRSRPAERPKREMLPS